MRMPAAPPPSAPKIAVLPVSAPKVEVAPSAAVARPSKPPKARRSSARIPAAPAVPAPRVKVDVAGSKSALLLAEAQKALIAGDAAGASNLYRLALAYAQDGASRGYAESGLKEARSVLADNYAATGRKEEKERQWSAAVAAYGKAADLRPNDPVLTERLANALREEGQDLTRATQLAELAVARAPRRASFKKTLGRVYADAGMRAKAIEALTEAQASEPDEDTRRLLDALRKRR
jgi:predicted Zn-dependent protease